MKLAHAGTAMLTVSTCLLLMSCKQKTGLEQLTAKYESLKGFRTTYVVQEPGKPEIEVKASGAAPGRIRVEGKGFQVVCNEVNGYYEAMFDRKIYDWQPNFHGSSVGTGTLIPRAYIMSGPGMGTGPQKLAPGKWKREPDVDGHEKYSQDWEGMAGKMHVELVVSKQGDPISYLAPNKVLYKIKSAEFVDDIPITEFNIDPPEGFICYRVDTKMPKLVIGSPLEMSIFSKGADQIEAHSFIAVYDPEVYDATVLKKWFNGFVPRAKRFVGTRGESSEALAITPEKFDDVFSSSPTLILTNEKGIIVGLWMGFDPSDTKEMELEIRQLLFEHT